MSSAGETKDEINLNPLFAQPGLMES